MTPGYGCTSIILYSAYYINILNVICTEQTPREVPMLSHVVAVGETTTNIKSTHVDRTRETKW